MQRPDPKKRKDIIKVAEKLFASKPFHEVKLDEVAAKAKIGKGTIYIYFRSKEDLFGSLLREAFVELNERVRDLIAQGGRSSLQELELVVSELVSFEAARPGMFQLLRQIPPKICGQQMQQPREEMIAILRQVIDRGVACGELRDACPELTAQFILSAVRGAMLFGPSKLTPEELTGHLTGILSQGIAVSNREKERRS